MINYLIIFYVIFLLVFLVFSAAGLYHLWRYGYVGDLTHPVIVAYSLLSGVIIFSSLSLVILRLIAQG